MVEVYENNINVWRTLKSITQPAAKQRPQNLEQTLEADQPMSLRREKDQLLKGFDLWAESLLEMDQIIR